MQSLQWGSAATIYFIFATLIFSIHPISARCMDDGIYEFKFGATGDVVKARYSFVYTKQGDEWKIAHHHSSQMPEEVVPKASLEAAAVV